MRQALLYLQPSSSRLDRKVIRSLIQTAGRAIDIAYGNSAADAIYFGIFTDSNHQPLDAAKSSYEFRFEKDQLPPSKHSGR
jgi:hypothetical protein